MEPARIELPSGTIEYRSIGVGPVILFLHGLLMDASLWDDVITDLSSDYRCVAPTLPLGAHRLPVGCDTDLSLRGLAAMLTELAEGLQLTDVTLVGNDTGGAIAQIILASGEPWVGRAVLVSCDAFDNFPPGLTGKALFAAGRLPLALFSLFMQQMRLRPVRRLPIAFGWLTKTGDRTTAGWIRSLLANRDVRRDTIRALRTLASERDILVGEIDRLRQFKPPVLVAWATADRVMPPQHGRRLAELFPAGRLVEIEDSYTLVPLDQPQQLAKSIRRFVDRTRRSWPR